MGLQISKFYFGRCWDHCFICIILFRLSELYLRAKKIEATSELNQAQYYFELAVMVKILILVSKGTKWW